MSILTLTSNNRCFDGEQHYYTHESSATNSTMTFSIYLPDKALAGKTCPAIMFLSGLTCSPDNPTHKAHFQKKCSEMGVIFIAPDTSPKSSTNPNSDIADDERYYVGQGASYYVDASQAPWETHFKMQSYIINEFYELVTDLFTISSIGLMGHSMGGHGALLLGFKYPSKFVSVSAIAPIAAVSESQWGEEAYQAYFGADNSQQSWSQHDAVSAIQQAGKQYPSILIDQGEADEFYQDNHLQTDKIQKVCQAVGQPLTLRYHASYDHSYYFVQSVMDDHIEHHYKATL